MKSYFITKPNEQLFTPVPFSKDEWIVRLPISYYSELLDKQLDVAPGFITDLASVPWYLWWKYPPSGQYDLAVVLHDLLYWLQITTRAQADNVLAEAILVCGCEEQIAKDFHFGVSTFGQGTWDKYAKEDKTTGFYKTLPDCILVPKLEGIDE